MRRLQPNVQRVPGLATKQTSSIGELFPLPDRSAHIQSIRAVRDQKEKRKEVLLVHSSSRGGHRADFVLDDGKLDSTWWHDPGST